MLIFNVRFCGQIQEYVPTVPYCCILHTWALGRLSACRFAKVYRTPITKKQEGVS